MTFGIDISTHQAGLDLAAARKAGAEFVIVKAVASYKPELTIADHYQSGIDRTIAAGLGHAKGHYAVPNSRNTPEATADFQMKIVYRRAETDALMLDNEPLDTYKVYWRDDNAAAYFYRLHDHGVRYDQMWFYCPAYLTRQSGPWPKIEALRKQGLKIVWVSYGDMDPYREDGEEPLLGGGITGWDVHQFTSAWTVPGYVDAAGNPKKVDGNYSPLSVGELFKGGGPVSLEDQMRTFISANQAPRDAATWDQMCGSLMYRFNSWRGWKSQPIRDISSAYRAAMGSSLTADFMRAPVGAFHFFDIAGPSNGHVMQDARGGGLVCLSSGYALSESLGRAIGFQSVPGYVAAKGARYLGWSLDYAGGTIDRSNLSGSGVNPIIDTPKGAPDMFLTRETNGTIYLQTGGGKVAIGNPAHVELINRMFKAWPGADTFNAAEIDIIDGYVRAASGSVNSDTATILDAISKVSVDPEVVKGAIVSAIAATSIVANVSPGDIEKIADEFAKRLAD